MSNHHKSKLPDPEAHVGNNRQMVEDVKEHARPDVSRIDDPRGPGTVRSHHASSSGTPDGFRALQVAV